MELSIALDVVDEWRLKMKAKLYAVSVEPKNCDGSDATPAIEGMVSMMAMFTNKKKANKFANGCKVYEIEEIK